MFPNATSQDHQALFSFSLDGEDAAAIDEVLAAGRRSTSDCYQWERGYSEW